MISMAWSLYKCLRQVCGIPLTEKPEQDSCEGDIGFQRVSSCNPPRPIVDILENTSLCLFYNRPIVKILFQYFLMAAL